MIAYKYLEPKNTDSTLTAEQEIFRASIVVQAALIRLLFFQAARSFRQSHESLKKQTEIVMKAGAEGGIYGRNIWGLPVKKGLRLPKR